MPRSPGDPFEPGDRVWFRENPDAYTFSRNAGMERGVAKDHEMRNRRSMTLVVSGDKEVWVPTDFLRSSPPRWLTGKPLPPKVPKPRVRKEAMAVGEELTIFDVEV